MVRRPVGEPLVRRKDGGMAVLGMGMVAGGVRVWEGREGSGMFPRLWAVH